MDRRRFLEYAVAGVAIAGSALAGYEFSGWQNTLVPPSVYTTTVTETQTLSETTTETVRLASVYGKLFFDYNGNGLQDRDEPAIAGALVQLKDSAAKLVAEDRTDSSGDYTLEDVKAGSYKLHLEADKRFTYMCTSPNEFRVVTDDYDLPLESTVRTDVGLMEGFMTLPVSKPSSFTWDRYWDWDPNRNRYLWWNGRSGFNRDNNYPSGFNHASIDYAMGESQPVLVSIPGE